MLEYRSLGSDTWRRNSDDVVSISGLANPFFNPSKPNTQYVLSHEAKLAERVDPIAFNESLRGGDQKLLHNHDSSLLLARRGSKTLDVWVGTDGLRFRASLPATTLGKDIGELVGREDLQGMSIGFRVEEEEMVEDGGWMIRLLKRIDLIELSTTPFPAYAGTRVKLGGNRLKAVG